MAKALGSVFELSIRYLLLLHASGKDPLTESRLCAEDFICTYAADFGIAAENLNGNSGYRYGEYASRCSMANDAIRHLVLRGMYQSMLMTEGSLMRSLLRAVIIAVRSTALTRTATASLHIL